ncbi:MAG: hypothetical protein ACO3M9_08315 [Flavobacteriaceae bacterium]
MKDLHFFAVALLTLFFSMPFLHAQEENDYDDTEEENYDILLPLNDPTSEGQTLFVEELLDLAGYVPEKIVIYQTLPNNARVFRVRLDSVTGGFVFVRFDKKSKENFVANKMIDPGVYFNLQAAKEIMRRQTDKATLNKSDVAIQASDQERITNGELNSLREGFQVKEEERLQQEKSAFEQRRDKARAKQLRKRKRKNN